MHARVDHLLNQNEIIHDLSTMNESSLVLRDDFGEDVPQSIRYYFGYHFVSNIAQGDQA